MVSNAEWGVLVQASMNLNQNMRSEQFSLVHDPEVAAFVLRLVDAMFEELPPGATYDRSMPGLAGVPAVEPDLGIEWSTRIEMGRWQG